MCAKGNGLYHEAMITATIVILLVTLPVQTRLISTVDDWVALNMLNSMPGLSPNFSNSLYRTHVPHDWPLAHDQGKSPLA